MHSVVERILRGLFFKVFGSRMISFASDNLVTMPCFYLGLYSLTQTVPDQIGDCASGDDLRYPNLGELRLI